MPDKLRMAIIGTGGIGLEHLKSLVQCSRATVVAISETDAKRARETADRYKIPRIYADYRELLDQPDVDAVTVALPNYLHASVALDAIQAQKHTLIEKPLATTAKEAARVVDAARKSKLTVMVGHNFRFHRGTQLARMLIQRNDLGEIYHARCFWLRHHGIPRIGSWFTQKKMSGGGCTLDLGVHLLDAAMHLMGEFDAATVSAQTFAKFGPRGLGEYDWGRSAVDPKKTFDVEDACVALVRLKSGRTLSLEICWAGFHPPDARESGIDLWGTQGGISLFPARLFRDGLNGYETVQISGAKVPQSEDRIHHFVGCVLDGKNPVVTLDESLKVQRVLDALYASASAGREVRTT